MEPMTAYAIYQGGKLIVNTIMGHEQRKASERAANVLEGAAARTAGTISSVGKSLYGNLELISDKTEQAGEKLMHKVGSQLEDVYDKFRNAPASFANNALREGARERASDSLWTIFQQGKEDLRLSSGDMKIKAFTDTFSKIGSIERQVGSMMSKVRNLRGQ
jgi:hypothetical protein